jgi:hypothetical protein
MHHLRYTPKWMSVALVGLLWLEPALAAQAETPPSSLELVVVQGEGALNSLGQRATQNPIVEVRDQNQRPLSGAAVVFTLPTEGASGEFGKSAKTLTIMTDDHGRAEATGLRVNKIPGKLQIHVNASYKGQTARGMITQFNMATPGGKSTGGGSRKTLLILALVGAAVAGGVVAGTQHSGHSNSGSGGSTPAASTPIGIVVGTGSVGPP